MPKAHRLRPPSYEPDLAPAASEPVSQAAPAIVVDEHGDDAAAVADAPPAADAPKPGPKARAKAGA